MSLFIKLPWPEDSEEAFWSSSQTAICLPDYRSNLLPNGLAVTISPLIPHRFPTDDTSVPSTAHIARFLPHCRV